MKSVWLFGIILCLASCSGLVDLGEEKITYPDTPPNSYARFTNSSSYHVSIYRAPERTESSLRAHLDGNETKVVPVFPDSNSTQLYLKYYLKLEEGVNVPYWPTDVNKNSMQVLFERNETKPVPIVYPSIDNNTVLLNDAAYVVIKNNAPSLFRLSMGTAIVYSETGEDMINSGQSALYKLPANSTGYLVRYMGNEYTLNSLLSSLQSGYVYSLNLNAAGTAVVETQAPRQITLANVDRW
jgi:hypothetical protein